MTPTGGEHFYFNYVHPDSGTNQIIKSFLNNSTKFRGKGIDIRSEGGYVVGPPSVRLGRSYEVTDLTAPSDIPPSLVAWLLEGHATKAPKKAAVVRQVSAPQTKHYTEEVYQYDLDAKCVWEILDQLPEDYLTDYTKWLTVTTVLKRHHCHSIWQEWCKRGGNYNEKQNETCWLSVKPILDINYLEWIVARAGGREVKQVTKFKPYEPIEKGLGPGWQSVCGSARYVSEL